MFVIPKYIMKRPVYVLILKEM